MSKSDLCDCIPLTIADFDRDKGTISLVIQAISKTTKEMQQNCRVGETLYALVGPLGQPSRKDTVKKVVCVGGGLGVAPIFPQVRGFRDNGAYVIGVLGFRTDKQVFWRDKFTANCLNYPTRSMMPSAVETSTAVGIAGPVLA